MNKSELKKTIGKRYVKFELHRTTKSTQDFVGIIWKSAILDSSWQIKDSIQGSKAKVIDHLQLKILANTHKGWLIDYKGNGMVLSKSYPLNTPAPSTTTAGGGSGSSGSTRGGSSTTDDLGRTTTPTSAKGDDETGSPDLSEKRV